MNRNRSAISMLLKSRFNRDSNNTTIMMPIDFDKADAGEGPSI